MADSIWDVIDREQGVAKELPHRAENAKQTWVEWALRYLRDNSPLAVLSNGEAWKLSRLVDGLIGQGPGLTDTQWGEALKLCRRYKTLLAVEEPG